ncbi:SpoIIE family protein phosphatase [bacterium]|nr:SpoIIE family protein phosphatase [bacterium]
MPPTILIVDDEEIVTKTLATYLELETDYHVHTFESPVQALEHLQKNQVDVAISDFFMPEMDGLQFLTEVKKLYPHAVRILLTGYADKENAIKAINDVGLFQYVEKPWDNEQVRLTIRNGLVNSNLRSILQTKIRELDNVLLERDKLAEQNEMLNEELMLARNVQESMLPQSYPFMNGISIAAKYIPALEIGGDFYDVIPLANNRVGVLIADVTGHGIKAALITVLLKSAFSAFKDCETSPSQILEQMNSALHNLLPKNLFVAAMVVVIDLSTSTCSVGNAGVPYPYLVRSNEANVERIHANGLLLGIADEDVYTPGKEISIHLQPGDRLILFTDGLSEAENEANAHFDHAGLIETLQNLSGKAGEELLEGLTAAARKFSKPEHNWDDVTILGIESN